MNESFEVILTHEEFTRLKEVERENERLNKALRKLKEEHEKVKLWYEQLEVTLGSHQLQIKELSKTTLRLSRKLLFEEEEHQKTQELCLAKEKELLEKLLAATSHSQNVVASMRKDKETKEKTVEDNIKLKNKLIDIEKNTQELRLALAQERERAVQAEGKCALCEREFAQAVRASNVLKAQLEQVSLHLRNASQESNQSRQQLSALRLSLQQQIGKGVQSLAALQTLRKQLLEQKAASEEEIRLLKSELQSQKQAFRVKLTENEQLQQKWSVLLASNRDLGNKMSALEAMVGGIKEEMTRETQRARRALQDFMQNAAQTIAQVHAECDRLLLQEKSRVLSREEVEQQAWRWVIGSMEKCREYLARDKIAEWKEVLAIEQRQLSMHLCESLSARLQEWVNDS